MPSISTRVVVLGTLGSVAAAGASTTPIIPGQRAPSFRLRKLGGGELSLNDLEGKVVLLAFWMPGCPNCAAEAPDLQTLHRKYFGAGLRVVGVAPLSDGVTSLHGFIRDHRMTYPTVVDARDKTAKQYGVSRYPVTVLIDRQGKVRWRHQGYQRGDASVLSRHITPLLEQKERPRH